MSAEIGELAGVIWKYLDRKGEITFAALVKGTRLNQRQADRAVGWLAREGKILVRKVSNKELVSLAEENESL